MHHFDYRDERLHAEDVALTEIAERYGTPCYVYSRATIEDNWRGLDAAFGSQPHLVCYAVKANANLAVLNLLARMGSGFDIVSAGELERVIAAGGDPAKTVFAGVGKSAEEMRRALEVGIRCFSVESRGELERLNQTAGSMDRSAPVSIRVNPDVDAKTHPYIATGLRENKFGIAIADAESVYQYAAQLEHIEVVGIASHIGSQLTEIGPFVAALKGLLALIDTLQEIGIEIRHIDVGGGIGIRYRDEQPPTFEQYAQAILEHIVHPDIEILIAPGRSVVGPAGILLTRVEYLKHSAAKNFVVVDAAMNDLIRPALYGAWQQVLPLVQSDTQTTDKLYDIVGPVCETGDFLAKDRELAVAAGDLLAVCASGAYGFAMSSNYNSRRRAPEIMVSGDSMHQVRRREEYADLSKGESIFPE